ncbi:hypothetical protein [Spirosoma spitsbergense]|uniref:TapB family protein n=1 Tax=Spirosoma spitsbergense TaxID=431554 RepID=UPI0003701765|nr:hypothetical protein [Spirosoma spitsbergense]
MKELIFSLLSLVILSGQTKAQECMGITFKTGMQFEMTTFNTKDKPTGKISYNVNDVHKEGGSTIMDMTAQFEDEKGKQRPPYTVRYTCTGDELVADLSGMMQSMQSNMKDMELKMKMNKLIYPSRLSVGQKLGDGQIEAELSTNGNTMSTMMMTMGNRKVEGTASITTPAGTFDTYKVTSDMDMENRVFGMPIRSSMQVVSYRSNNQILDVKSETYRKGKLIGYTLLTKAN